MVNGEMFDPCNNSVERCRIAAEIICTHIDKPWYNIFTTHTKHGAFAFLDAVYHNNNVMGKQPLSFGRCPVVCVVTTAKNERGCLYVKNEGANRRFDL